MSKVGEQITIWDRLRSLGLLTSCSGTGTDPNMLWSCQLVCAYMDKEQLDAVLELEYAYTEYTEAAASEIFEREFLGKKRALFNE
jgi:hypothetical protein